MIALSDNLELYLQANFHPELQITLRRSFAAISKFHNFYEDEFSNLTTKTNNVDNDNLRLAFVNRVKNSLTDILKLHSIRISSDNHLFLHELNELVETLYRLSHLESYSDIDYIISSNLPVRVRTINLFNYLTNIEEVRLYELIEEVNPKFIQDLQSFISTSLIAENLTDTVPLEKERLYTINSFREFIGEQEALGVNLYNKGFINVTLYELVNLMPYSLHDYVKQNAITDTAKVALDLLSLSVVTTDDYLNPIKKLENHSNLFFLDTETSTRITHTAKQIYQDFQLFHNAKKQKEKLNAQT